MNIYSYPEKKHHHPSDGDIANLRYPAKNDTFFAGERRYSH
jgi:hypothetical protein